MYRANLTDLDALLLTVREPTSRAYLAEAVIAYRGGAYRAAVISTWIAINYDILAKIRELAYQGDSAAFTLVGDMDRNIEKGNIARLQQIEESLLHRAREDFEFITAHEYEDLKRIKKDRNLCAHPAIVADRLYQPSPELVRTHIVHAVTHLLQHQPVQGKSAIDRILGDISRNSFPTNQEDICTFLNNKYLDKAKNALLVNLVSLFLKLLLKKDPAFEQRSEALLLSLVALGRRHSNLYREQMAARLEKLADGLNDDELWGLFPLLSVDPESWQALAPATRLRLKTVLGELDCRSEGVGQLLLQYRVFDSFEIEGLGNLLDSIFDKLPLWAQADIICETGRSVFCERAVGLYVSARSFRSAESLGRKVVLPLAPLFSPLQIKALLAGVLENSQIRYAGGTAAILEQLLPATKHHWQECGSDWVQLSESLAEGEQAEDRYAYPGLRKELQACGLLDGDGKAKRNHH